MIQVYVLTAPLGQHDPEATVTKLRAASQMVSRLFDALRGYTVAAAGDTVTVHLRVSGRTRWHVQGDARRIASNLLMRASLAVQGATLELDHTLPTAKSLTKEQGRSVRTAPERP